MVQVLFVCLGNICRSPMAEAIFQDLVNKADLTDKIKVDSAGTSRYHIGAPAHQGTRQILKSNNIPYNGRARQVTTVELNHPHTWIIAMDDSNLHQLKQMGQPSQLHRLTEFSHTYQNVANVPDPYYTGDFNYVFELVQDSCVGLLQAVLAHSNQTK